MCTQLNYTLSEIHEYEYEGGLGVMFAARVPGSLDQQV